MEVDGALMLTLSSASAIKSERPLGDPPTLTLAGIRGGSSPTRYMRGRSESPEFPCLRLSVPSVISRSHFRIRPM